MNLYFAPLEGITTYTYRNTHKEYFGSCDVYYSPFINPSDNEKVSMKNLRDILPERNENISLTVQVLTNKAEAFLKFADKVRSLGYDELNINLGCPSGTVVNKGRGAGILRDTDGLDDFLYQIFSKSDMKISVKTRTGYDSSDEVERLIEIFNKYPITELIVHPRTRMDFYDGKPDLDAFEKVYTKSRNRICYNGDIRSKNDYKSIISQFPDISGVMIGRGAIANPAIFREIRGGKRIETDELIDFTKKLIEKYKIVLGSEVFTLQKMKEIWLHMMCNFPNEKKILKAIKKSKRLGEFVSIIEMLPEI